jgi:WD40 repeat protein
VRAVAWSPDNTHLLTGGNDRTVRVWDAHTGEPIHQLTGHTNWVFAVAWSPDNTHLLTGGGDDTARIWQATDGQPTGFTISILPGSEVAVFDAVSDQLAGVTEGAWRWLGYNVIENGQLTRLPAESFGPLPPLTRATGSAKPESKSSRESPAPAGPEEMTDSLSSRHRPGT